ncbi:MAG: terminase large subunit, partial [Pseudomonadota bacterium]
IFKQLRMPDVDGFPTYGEACGEWVFQWVRAIFGSYDPVAKVRYLREFFCMIPKKNGKTSIAAAIIVVACIMNESPEGQFILIAPTIKLAETAFDHAAGIIKRTAFITDLFYSQPSSRTLKNLNPDIPSKILIKAADADIVTGVKNATVLVDETHVFAARPTAKGIFTEIRGALSHPKNRHFLLQITTQSKVPPTGVFRAELATARRVRDGKADLPLLPLLYELPLEVVKDGGWKRPETWPLINPHMGRSVDEAFLADEVSKAEDQGADALALVASQHFNVEIGTGQGDDGWTAQRHWDGAVDATLTLEALLNRSEVCVVGVDGGGEDDLCGLVVLGREAGSRALLAWCHAWAQPEVLVRRKSIAPALEGFAADGDLTICEQAFEHVAGVVEVVAQVADRGLLPAEKGIGIDEAGLPELIDELELA